MDSWEDGDVGAVLQSLQDRLKKVVTVEEEKQHDPQVLKNPGMTPTPEEKTAKQCDEKKVKAAFNSLAKGKFHHNPLEVVLDYLRIAYDFKEGQDSRTVTGNFTHINQVPTRKGTSGVVQMKESLELPRALLLYAYFLTIPDGPREVAVSFRKFRGYHQRERVFDLTIRFQRQEQKDTDNAATRFYKQLAYMDRLVLSKDSEHDCSHMSNKWVSERSKRSFTTSR